MTTTESLIENKTRLRKKYDLGIVIPTYNEKDNINELLDRISDEAEEHNLNITVLVVDDNSPDSTGDIVQGFIDDEKYSNLHLQLMRREGKQGLASAYKQGFGKISNQCSFVMSMDADLSHNPSYVSGMLSTAQSGYDCVIGSRYVAGGGVRGWGPSRLLISRLGSLYAQIILLSGVRDQTGGFNLYRTDSLAGIELEEIKAEGYMFQIEMKYTFAKRKCRIKEFPIVFTDRVRGKSKISRKIILEAFIRVPLLRLGL